jgi:hypothetical protein
MNIEQIQQIVKDGAINDAEIFVRENDCAFDQNSGSGEYEAISVREYLAQNGIDRHELSSDDYDGLLNLYAETIAAESEAILAAQ